MDKPEQATLSRRKWLVGLAGKAAGQVAEVVQERLPDSLNSLDGSDAEAVEEVAPVVAYKLVFHSRHCIAVIGIDCGACARLCPEGVRGLWLSRGRPFIDPEACVACAECMRACPTSPRALDFVEVHREPTRQQPGPG